ncbi:hypothetical protein DL93DRAFT_2069596, partial [Clavulina sp. PMI_390]
MYDGLLWKNTGQGPRRVILQYSTRQKLIRRAHDESGHRGRDPTYKKLVEFYYWPHMWRQIAVHCRTCYQCQIRSTYRPIVPISPTW